MAITTVLSKNVKVGANSNQSAIYHGNGIKITATINTSGTTYKDYCPKCGQLKSNHTGLFSTTCPK
jgi:hypothetical protein